MTRARNQVEHGYHGLPLSEIVRDLGEWRNSLAVSKFIVAWVPLVEGQPILLPVVSLLLLSAVRRYRVGRECEEVLERTSRRAIKHRRRRDRRVLHDGVHSNPRRQRLIRSQVRGLRRLSEEARYLLGCLIGQKDARSASGACALSGSSPQICCLFDGAATMRQRPHPTRSLMVP